MGWFKEARKPPPVVAVLGRHGDAAVGAAALLSPGRALTCAHVVNEALGRPPLSGSAPAGEALQVGFARRTVRIEARIEVWLPPRRGGAGAWQGDLCVLRLAEPAPAGAAPVVWTEMTEGQSLRAWHGCGEPITFADTVLKLLDDQLGYLDGELSGAAIGPGFSGGPLWTDSGDSVAGLVVGQLGQRDAAAHPAHTLRRTWALPWQAVRDQLYAAGAGAVVADCRTLRAAPQDDPLGAELTELLRSLLPDPAVRAEHARRLAAELGLPVPQDGSAPRVEELTAVLLTRHRALPTLSESLLTAGPYGARPDRLTALLGTGRAVEAAGLLSLGEYAFLEKQLRCVVLADATLPARAAQEALRYTPLPSALCTARLAPEALGQVIADLEEYQDGGSVPAGTPRVPALVHLVEFIAAASGGPLGAGLSRWSERVCDRLGVHPAARDQRRADAAHWAGARAPQVTRLLARLTRTEPEGEVAGTGAGAGIGAGAGAERVERYRCRLWQQHADGSVRRLDTAAGDAPLTPEQVGALIREGAERSGDALPAVDIEVDRDGLHLPVDEWDAGSPNEFVPSLPLGASFPLTLRCPEMSRRVPRRDVEHRRRWGDGHGRPLVIDPSCADGRQVAALLNSTHRDANHVVLHGPPALRAQLLDLCLALGVPVVLWDREAEGHDQADRLEPLAPTGRLHELPFRVHRFRAASLPDPTGLRARPSLVWEDLAWQDRVGSEHEPRLTDPDAARPLSDEGVRRS
ncbi:trypsin-like peptidase domain-containing protein [Streptomyces kanamyceticus]|uniref:VMAP-C domain-containing protein n=1 Tax=Streptomyces kanamyceticus TaxID=1967 RepID=UPI0006E191BD|nr:trypsin-like peptidase domain-containing protein [Streptomyces kanamyceticus]